MLGGEAEPEGMYDDQYGEEYEYGEEANYYQERNYMGGSKEKKGNNLQVPTGKGRKGGNHGSEDEGNERNFPLEDLSEGELESQMFSMVQK